MKEIEIPEGYEARIDGNKVIIELKESGDEKIRKELLEVIRHCYEDGGYALCTDDYKKYSAYLEKQKEQKPNVIIPKFRIGDTICLKGSMAEFTIESIDAEYYHGNGWGLPISAENNYELVEQKTVWSEEDENFIKELCNLLASIAKNNYVGCYYAPDLVSKLRSLRPQSKQEWSEEDENYYDTIVRKLQVIGDDSGLTRNQIDFLDTHRPQPHWKPSEEQMKAILSAINYVPFGGDTGGYLKSLYNDLKKL